MGHLFLDRILLSLPYLFEQGMNSGQMEECLQRKHMSLFVDSDRKDLSWLKPPRRCPLKNVDWGGYKHSHPSLFTA